MNVPSDSANPLASLDDWEDEVVARYPEPGQKAKEDYRNYDAPARDSVREFYRLHHQHQTYDFVLAKKREYLSLDHREMTVLEAMEYLNTLVDDSDPDIDLSQREHLLLYTNQLLATVARRHSGVDGQEAFNRWIEDMELNDPALFLPRLRNVVDVLVQDEWWFDRDALQAALPAD